jgi:hypothetical protein
MRSEERASLRKDQAQSGEATPRRDASVERFQRVTPPVNLSSRVAQPWIQAAEAVVDWYGAMFRLAFGLGRLNNSHESQSVVTSPPAPHAGGAESAPAAPLKSIHSAPVRLRPKRGKSPSPVSSRSRSSKVSSSKRTRRAA